MLGYQASSCETSCDLLFFFQSDLPTPSGTYSQTWRSKLSRKKTGPGSYSSNDPRSSNILSDREATRGALLPTLPPPPNLKLLRKWNPFAPGNFAPKPHLKARRTILQSQNDQNTVYRLSTLRPSSTFCSICQISASAVWTCAESKLSWLLITFRFLSSICFVFLALYFFFRWTSTMLHFGGKSFWESF